MKESITIKNLGPLKDIEIELNRINVFIGPQSSGKSTIAKIISFCQWLEKDCISRNTTDQVTRTFTRDSLIKYHNISDYISEGSEFTFHGKALHIHFAHNKLTVTKNEGFDKVTLSKNAYIPSERNVLAVPGILSTKMPDNYLLEFIDDWQQIRGKYAEDDKLSILNLDGSYYFDETGNRDMLRLDNGKSIHLTQASSGLQSVTPLCVYIDYLTSWIFSHDEDQSAEDRERIRRTLVTRAVDNLRIEDPELFDRITIDYKAIDIDTIFNRISGPIENTSDTDRDPIEIKEDLWLLNLLVRMSKLGQGTSRPSRSNIVIEEPEQNLFPETQARLLYYILSKINHKRDSLVITTHSPYILYALNNCMLAHTVKGQADDIIGDMTDIPESSFTDPASVSVWELGEGTICNSSTIQDEQGLIRGNYFDRVMHNIMADFNNLLNFTR